MEKIKMADSSVPKSATSVSAGASSDPAMDQIKSDVNVALNEAHGVVGKLAEEASDQVAAIADEARNLAAQQTDKLKGIAGEQKDLLAEQIGGVADAMEKVADELEANNGSSARYARLIADNADQFSTTIRQNDVDALLNMAQDFGRKQPAAFVGVAALLGFAASRFLLASANRPTQTTNTATTNAGNDSSSTQNPYGSADNQAGRV
jgi:ElaB/YqjD/DUF883 family membrane-anchored ribosome-binding protein